MQLDDVLATEQLALRGASKEVDSASVLAFFERQRLSGVSKMCSAVAEHLLTLCDAQSAGVSIFANPRYDELTWVSAAGVLAEFRTRRFPRRHSLCGVCLDRKSAQLFINPHRYFTWIAQAGVRIREGLVAPLYSGDAIYGTIWVMAHNGGRRFDSSDASILTIIASRTTQILAGCRARPLYLKRFEAIDGALKQCP